MRKLFVFLFKPIDRYTNIDRVVSIVICIHRSCLCLIIDFFARFPGKEMPLSIGVSSPEKYFLMKDLPPFLKQLFR